MIEAYSGYSENYCCGWRKVGTALCHSLVAENHDVVLNSEPNPFLTMLCKRFDVIGILGSRANFKNLRTQHADVTAHLFISVERVR